MADVRLLLDEDVPRLLAQALRVRGHDFVHAIDAAALRHAVVWLPI